MVIPREHLLEKTLRDPKKKLTSSPRKKNFLNFYLQTIKRFDFSIFCTDQKTNKEQTYEVSEKNMIIIN